MLSRSGYELNNETHQQAFGMQLEWNATVAINSTTAIVRASAGTLTIVVQFRLMGNAYTFALGLDRRLLGNNKTIK